MHIFNQGKYKSLHAQTENELAQIRQTVLKDNDFYPTYHLAPKTGLFNDPNGLIFDGEKYHVFAQWFPYDAIHGMKHWAHFITTDFQTFTQGDFLIPDEMFESHGCYSGGAILWEDRIVAFYTGNTRRPADNQRVPHQNIAIFDKSGKLLEKRCIIDQAPKGYTEHVRDPKPYITAEGKIRFVLGAQRENLTGACLVYEMDDLNATPRLISELTVANFDNQNVFMWECPDLFSLKGKDVFVWSPQGKARELHQFQNNYHATYALGQLDQQQQRFNADYIEELDYGFDFYAPQTVQQSDRILFGWVGLPDLTYPTDRYQWHSTLTMPRQIRLENNRIYQSPIVQLGEKQAVALSGEIANLDTAYLHIEVENQPLELTFFQNPQGQHLTLRYENGLVTLDRSQTEQTDLMKQLGEVRYCEIEQLRKIEIFFDRSIVEIFLNDGDKVMTSRFFIADRQNIVQSSRAVRAEVAQVKPINVVE